MSPIGMTTINPGLAKLSNSMSWVHCRSRCHGQSRRGIQAAAVTGMLHHLAALFLKFSCAQDSRIDVLKDLVIK